MLTFRNSIRFTLSFALVAIACDVSAQSRTQPTSRNVRSSERVARASWQPVRGEEAKAEIPQPPPLVRAAVEPVDHIVPGESIVIDPPVHMPLDGQVVLSPIDGMTTFGGGACDSLPPGQCGCGDAICMGDCGGGGCDGGCDSLGSCGGGSCGGGNCSTCGELCSSEAWRPCITLCLPQDGWINLEYLSWFQDGMSLPPLVTTSAGNNVLRTEAGVLGQGATRTLFGGSDVLDDAIDGSRLRFGVWLDRCHTWGIGAEFFGIGQETESFTSTSTGDPILARPFFNTETGVEDSELVAFPGVVSGTVSASATSEFSGGGLHLRYLRCCDEGCGSWLFCGCPEHFCSRTEAMMGYRYLELDESVQINEDLVSTDSNQPGGFDITDRFRTLNQFNGLDLGWMYRRTRGFWTFDSLLRLGVGNTRQRVTISGSTTINDPSTTPTSQTFDGGLLTQTSNIGTYENDEFSVVPELNANIGYQLTDHFRATLGYTFIYWSNVVRPGDQISRDLNPNLLPPAADPLVGTQRPGFQFDTTDYWVQGLSIGGEYRW